MRFIGIDPHTNKFTCCYREEDPAGDGNSEKRIETFTLDSNGLEVFYQTLTHDTYVLVEATGPTFSFTRLIQPLVKEVMVANTYELKQISLDRKKTDKSD